MITFYWDNKDQQNQWNPNVLEGQTPFGETMNTRPRGYMWDCNMQNCVHNVSTDYTEPGFWYISLYGYLFELSGHGTFTKVTENHEWIEEERWDEEASKTLIKAIPEHVKNGMRDHKLVMVVDNSAEGKDLNHTEVYYIQCAMKEAGLPRGSIIVITGAANMDKTYHQRCYDLNYLKYLEIGQPMIDFLHLPCFEQLDTQVESEIEVNPILKAMADPDSKDFMSLNMTIKRHRMEHLYWIICEDFHDRGLISGSWVREGKLQQSEYLLQGNNALSFVENSKNSLMVERTSRVLPLHADYDCTQEHCDNLPNNYGVFNRSLYERSLLSFVTESEFGKNQNSIFLTEKTYKTIVGGHPFILLGTHGSMAYLEAQGYKMQFCDIDLKYDSINDPKQRFEDAHNQLRRWILRPRAEKIALLQRDMHILEYNRKKAISELRHIYEDDVMRNKENTHSNLVRRCFKNIEKFLSAKQSEMESRITLAKFVTVCELDESQQSMLTTLIDQEVNAQVEKEHDKNALLWREIYNAETLSESVNANSDITGGTNDKENNK